MGHSLTGALRRRLVGVRDLFHSQVRKLDCRTGRRSALRPGGRRSAQASRLILLNVDSFRDCSIILGVRATASEIRAFLRKLDGSPADSIESESLECKPWDPDPRRLKEQLRELREAVVSLANAKGGAVVLGIQDRMRTRKEAIAGVGDLRPDTLRKAIYDGTDPHLLVDCEEIVEPEGRLLVLHVPQGLGVHTTSEGVAKVRVGKDCQPLTGSMLARLMMAGGDRDLTAQPLDEATLRHLDPEWIRSLQKIAATEGSKPELAAMAPAAFLETLGLLQQGQVTLAAVLLVGMPTALARWVPQHELIFLHFKTQTRVEGRHDLRGPILAVMDAMERLIEARRTITIVETGGFKELAIPDLSWPVVREAVLNALVHRDYFLRRAVQIELRKDTLQVASPGGFIGGIHPGNVLRHHPVRRNPLLAQALQTVGLVNRAGVGVDRMYEELLLLGKAAPRYDADEEHVQLTVPLRTHEAFASFVAEERRAGVAFELDDLILLRAMCQRGVLDRWSSSECLQLAEQEAAARLASLRQRGYLLPAGRGRGTTYRFTRHLSDRLRGPVETDLDASLDEEAIRLRVETVLSERGRLTNADVRRLTGYTRIEVVRLMRRMVEEGIASLHGKGRAAHYRPALVHRSGRKASRTKE